MYTKPHVLGRLCILFICTGQIVSAYSPWKYNGTTPDLETIVKGRCYSYKLLKLDNRNPELQMRADCVEVWNTFIKAFKDKDACKENLKNAYDELLTLIDNGELVKDKMMFWSGTKDVAHDFTQVNPYYRTLEDTFPGYFADGLTWCGCESCAGGLEYNNTCDWNCGAGKYFWEAVSRQFAAKASGIASVMVNGTAKGSFTAYRNTSIFGRFELPEMGKGKKVKRLDIYVVNTLDKKPKENCNKGTLVQLVKDAYKYGIPKVQCIDDPSMVQYVLCAKYYKANECQQKEANRMESDSDGWRDATIVLIVFILILIGLYVFERYTNAKRKNSDNSKPTVEA